MERRTFLKNTGIIGLATVIGPAGIIQTKANAPQADDLLEKFKSPPPSAKPHTWWHWMNGNVTKEGITLDLEAMARVGIGGFQNFDAGTGIPKGPVVYLSPEWIGLKKHAIAEADRLGLEFTMHNCPGWSSSGGPWITPDLAMQELTWSELVVEGGMPVKTKLPRPFSRLNTYRDIATVAVKSFPGEVPLTKKHVRIMLDSSDVDPEAIVTGITLTPKDNSPSILEFRFSGPVPLQQVSMVTTPGEMVMLASDDGITYRETTKFNIGNAGFGAPAGEEPFTLNFSPVQVKFIRLVSAGERSISHLRFSGVPRFRDWKEKANYAFNRYGTMDIDPAVPAIDIRDIVDLSENVSDAGELRWNAPAGNWTILRFGFTPIGTQNRSAPDTGVGLECDKYNDAAFEFHFYKMMESLLPFLETSGKKGKVGMLIDSYEVGMQNWTSGFDATFKERAGYDLVRYLPAFTGRVVGTAETTDRFLWDVRRVQGDLMADNYYGKFTDLCHQNKIIAYIQPYDRGPMEEMQIGSRIDINVGEFWNNLSSIFQNNATMRRTVKLSAAIAHTNDQTIVAAESFTGEPESSKWQEHPFALKMLGDRMFTQGLNRMVFHRFAHQPHPTARPGMTMGPWGSHFDRTNTWWEQGRAWMTYLARCQYLLQTGHFVADFVYFTGESAGVYTRVERHELVPPPPDGFDYDLINAETLQRKAFSKNGFLEVPSGTTYRILVLQDFKTMSVKLLKRIRELSESGVTIVGDKPVRMPGLSGEDSSVFTSIVDELWGSGRIVPASRMYEKVAGLRMKPDFQFTSASGDAPIRYIHRKTTKEDVFFISSERRTYEDIVCQFRIDNKQPEIWDPVSGKIYKTKLFRIENGHVSVALSIAPAGSIFVIFRDEPVSGSIRSIMKGGSRIATTDDFSVKRKIYPDAVNSFSITLWAKPENSVMLTTRNFMDGQLPWTDFFAIYPSPGIKLYGQDHATAGLAIGRNGVAVWENATGVPEFLFSVKKNISGWAHVAVVYDNGVASIYINGVREQESEKSKYSVHPAGGHAYLNERASFYNGDLTDLTVHGSALSDETILRLSEGKPALPATAIPSYYNDGERIVALSDGIYSVEGSGKTMSTRVERSGALELSSDWVIDFPGDQGAPGTLRLEKLVSLHLHDNEGVRFFSGTCTYSKSFEWTPAKSKLPLRYYLDLGSVEVMAEVMLNGKSLGVLWARPFVLDITRLLIKGGNDLRIKVTNLWPNRLIGDQQVGEVYKFSPGGGGGGFASLSGGAILELPEWYKNGEPKPDDGRIAFATWRHYTKDSPLLQSGLIGPVVIRIGSELRLP